MARRAKNNTETPDSKSNSSSGTFSAMLRSPASGTIIKTLEQEADECYQSILLPINERMMGPLPQSEIITSRPMVLLLGNHSSGKSSFINFLVGSEVQKSGVAPTDDSFTLITSGMEDTDQDGPALVGDPDLGFMALRNFGNALISHVQLKVRKNLGLKNVILVDSPGMIDCPAVSAPAHLSTSERLRLSSSSRGRESKYSSEGTFDRGYNFMAVTRWFAEHSDVILLFFDPDKPGTTGETLECLTKALNGMEHKLNIIFNKCDQFNKMHDFARAFGALCWNLSKVIPRKDLPPIYTMCVPTPNQGEGLGKEALLDLHSTRSEVVNKVNNAQERRVDNMISRLDDSTRVLQMYAWVCTAAVYKGKGDLIRRFGQRWDFMHWPVFIGGQTFSLMFYMFTAPRIKKVTAELTEDHNLTKLFEDNYRMQIAEGDEFLHSLWQRVMPRLQLAMRTVGIRAIGHAGRRDNEYLNRILNEDVPRLRRQFARAIGDTASVTPVLQGSVDSM
ncbi:hypothetical protein GUITHDRAFT_160834 [Guillardia theta CCMP2712]|uniref:Dynamin N-terminal domain-containing protein n=1 Tax=Guillardia theta (strain CCMP2712) TaxID=905079 RepID=L1K0W6_GUITC|nr:hypothetical protein GUITHDRAFT_160834 [Guillardia theta CCMP2712]EKX54199.1 hypothetical protein GUITHDRAFT_160834 [Guillardia theta CCMP2712]|eukprot:XP_005841179.1 hypothetical protein GUITHDRAFT_160834 [Guillardia theta CCMP2712]